MKTKFKPLTAVLIIGVIMISCNQNNESKKISQNESKFAKLSGPYLGQESPGMTPELFAPGLLTAGGSEAYISFSPDGMELCYTFWTSGEDGLAEPRGPFLQVFAMYSCLKNGNWTEPIEFPYLPDHKSIYPVFSPDGQRIYFAAWGIGPNRPMYVERSNGEWSDPKKVNLGDSNQNVGLISTAANRNLYLANIDGFYKYSYENGKYTIPEKFSKAAKEIGGVHHTFIAPDESYIIFDYNKSENSFGMDDLYISFRDNNGEWMKAQNMGKGINTKYRDKRAFVSFDGKYLFFASERVENPEPPKRPVTLKEVQQLTNVHANGYQHIYWVDAKVIEELRPKN